MFFVAWFWAYFNAALFPADAHMVGAHRAARRRVAAEGDRDLRSLASAAAQHADPAHLRHDRHLGAPCAAGERPRGPEVGPDPHHRARRAVHRVQAYEYSHAAFDFSGNIYGATFFMATGFHGAHVLIGTTFLIVCLIRAYLGHFTPTQHLGFEFCRLVLALRRRGLAVPVRLHLCLGRGRRCARRTSGVGHRRSNDEGAAAMAAPFACARRVPRLRLRMADHDHSLRHADPARSCRPLSALRRGQAVRRLPARSRRAASSCGLDFSFADSADGPAFFVMSFSGFVVVFAALAVEVALPAAVLGACAAVDSADPHHDASCRCGR